MTIEIVLQALGAVVAVLLGLVILLRALVGGLRLIPGDQGESKILSLADKIESVAKTIQPYSKTPSTEEKK